MIASAVLIWVAVLGLDGWRAVARAEPILVALALSLLMLGIVLATVRWGIPMLATRRFQRTHSCIAHDTTFRVSRDSFSAECETTTTVVKWHGVVQSVETGEFFLFYVDDACAHYLPKRAIGAPATLTRLRQMLAERLGPRARTRMGTRPLTPGA